MALCNDECFYNDWNVNVHDKIVALLKKHSGEGDPLGHIDLKGVTAVTSCLGTIKGIKDYKRLSLLEAVSESSYICFINLVLTHFLR